MNKPIFYQKRDIRHLRTIFRIFGVCLSFTGLIFGAYFFFPLVSWAVFLQPALASSDFASPIPQTTIVTKEYIQSLWENTEKSLKGLATNNSQSWLPHTSGLKQVDVSSQVSYYFISIPKIRIENAIASTIDIELLQHLVNFPGTAIPPGRGNSVIFGHSTLPYLFDPKNYKTILANAHTLVIGDDILITVNGFVYTYKIENIYIVSAKEADSYMRQDADDSYLTLITCTPPGTIWKRLIIKARIERI